MQNIKLNLNIESLKDLLKSYYELTKIKIAIFDEKYQKLITYPDKDCPFCSLMKSRPKTASLCNESDRNSFEIVKSKKELFIYHCHAGLVEASAPLIQDNVVVGYMMFGQVCDSSNKNEFFSHIENLLISYDFELSNLELCKSIKFRNQNQIKDAAKILEACTFYVLLKDYIRLSNENFINRMNEYIDNNINKDISIETLMNYFNMSKNKLYDSFALYSDKGIAAYIKERKIEKAKHLLKESKLKVNQVSSSVGFNDYNYFCRTFKKMVGISAKKYRNQSF